MAAADLVVCRSGALTVTEIAIVGVPAIMIPFPYAAENHQYYNAKTLEDAGAGMIIEEKDLSCLVINGYSSMHKTNLLFLKYPDKASKAACQLEYTKSKGKDINLFSS